MSKYSQIVDGSKTCSSCKVSKPVSDFSFTKNRGVLNRCKDCVTMQRVAWLLGVSRTDVAIVIKERGKSDVCSLCLKRYSVVENRRPCIDHDHKTGKLRKIICGKCNLIIAWIEEDSEALKRIATYLESYKTQN